MSQFAREHPEDYEERLEAMVDAADLERKRRKESPKADLVTFKTDDPATKKEIEEAVEAEALREQDPGRWPEWASPARMRRDLEREREEDERYGY